MAGRKSHHVVRAPQGGWSVIRGGAERASKHFETKGAAIRWGQRVSQNQGTEFFIHGRDGSVERKDSRDHA
ncbi:MAG TPA: DUF2188 domain-containing protein [Thermoanaerobaculia bacterium]|nr:DUF2188 domain-containing protein [Thermoanaerobaculia bacterium]